VRNKIAAIFNLVEEKNALRPLTNRRPIATVPFAGRYRIIDFPFSSLYYARVSSAAMFLTGSGHSLYDHIRSGSQWGLDSLVGGGVFTHSQVDLEERTSERYTYYDDHKNFVDRSKSDYILLMGNKIIYNVNLRSFLEFYTYAEPDVGVIYKKMPRNLFAEDTKASYFTFDNDTEETVGGIQDLKSLSEEENEVPVSLDVMLMKKEKFYEYLAIAEQEEVLVSPTEFIRLAIEADDTVAAYEHNDYTRFVETMNDFFEANMDMLQEKNFYSLFNRTQPIITKVKNGAPTYFGNEAEVTNSQFASDCVVDGHVLNSMVHRKTTIESGADVSHSVMMYGCMIEEDAVLRYAILDKNVIVKKGVQLVGTRENPIVIKKNAVIEESIMRDGE